MEPGQIECLRGICAEVGFDLDLAKASLLERMRLLAEDSQFFADSIRIASYALAVFRHYEADRPSETFSLVERRTVVLGCLFSDIGKTGPERADADARRLIVEMFAVEGVRDDTMSVAVFLRTYFSADFEQRAARLEGLGLSPEMSIRQFWNLHSGWTLAIAETAGVPAEAVAAAASHHLLDGVNPQDIVGEDGRFTRAFGENLRFDRAEKLVIVLDKYDAVRRRGRRLHDETIAWLRERIEKHARFRGDAEFETLIADVDLVLRLT